MPQGPGTDKRIHPQTAAACGGRDGGRTPDVKGLPRLQAVQPGGLQGGCQASLVFEKVQPLLKGTIAGHPERF